MISSASASGISIANSSSMAMTTSTASRESRPRSLVNEALFVSYKPRSARVDIDSGKTVDDDEKGGDSTHNSVYPISVPLLPQSLHSSLAACQTI